MLTPYLRQSAKRIAPLKTDVFLDDIFTHPRGQTLLLPVFEGEIERNAQFNKIDRLLKKRLSQKLKTISFIGKENELFSLSPADFPYEEMVIFGLGRRKEFNLGLLAQSFAGAVRYIRGHGLSSGAILAKPEWHASFFEIGKFLSEAFYLAQYSFDAYKSAPSQKKIPAVKQFNFYLNSKAVVKDFQKGAATGRIIAEGIYLARDLVNEPASHMHPKTLVSVAAAVADESAGTISVQVLNERQCRDEGMGAFLGVAQGSDHKPQFIIVKYQNPKSPAKRDPDSRDKTQKKTICLIGKSITFDSGGLSLKPAEAMETMKIDMAGGATVLGLFKSLSDLAKQNLVSIDSELYGILPACENMPSGCAMRPGDIVRAANGKTIEVVNTDAEGRLILADALAYAEKYIKPTCIIDLATLTGAIMISLGEQISGLFCNDEDLSRRLREAADTEGERLWQMPLYRDYLSKIKSPTADLKNAATGRYGGAITGALFLQEFVTEGTPWAHLDIAGASYNDGEARGLIEKGGTGWGIKTLVRLLTQ